MATAVGHPRAAPPTWPVTSGSLLLGFAVAQATGVRPLGGVVLALGATWCGLGWLRSVGRARTAALVCVYIAMFVLSHVMADAIGTWPAVIVAAAVAGLAALVVADIPASRGASTA